MLDSIRTFSDLHGLLPQNVPVFSGFSGGPDSTALVLALQALDIQQTAVHFQHGLRDDAEADADWCRTFCEDRKIAFRLVRLDVPSHQERGESVEMAARRLRLAAWSQLLAEAPNARVALGHHRDDVIETLLMRMFRGANASGLTGLRPFRDVGGIPIVRPLLGIRRAAIEAFLDDRGIVARLDSSNSDAAYQRNRVRNELLPLINDIAGSDGIAKSADFLLEDARVLEGMAGDCQSLTVAELGEAPHAMRLRMLRSWSIAQGHGELVLGAGSVAKLHAILDGPATQERRIVEIDADRKLVLDHDALQVADAADVPAGGAPVTWDWRMQPELTLSDGRTLRAEACREMDGGDLGRVYFDAARLPCPLVVRGRQAGDRMTPFGCEHFVRVKKLLAHTKQPLAVRNRAVVVADMSGTLLWLAPYRRSSLWPVLDEATSAVCLSIHDCFDREGLISSI